MASSQLGQEIWDLADAAKTCRACPLWANATQTVFGEGSTNPRIVLVGEQPGDQEDIQGKPFVGPAGKLLRACLAEAGVDMAEVYITNAVKHFKWKPSGSKRLHQKPNQSEIQACRPWLSSELAALEPDAILCLGVTASESVLGRPVKLAELRGRPIKSTAAPLVMATIHPSSLLRIPDPEGRHEARAAFIADIRGLVSGLKGAS